MGIRIQLRRNDAATWTSDNPTLAEGELGAETDTGMLKVGDGSTDWATLPYIGAGGGGSTYSAVKAYRSAALTIAANTVTMIEWDAELWDTDAYHDTSANKTKLVAPATGKYRLHALVMDSSHGLYIQLRAKINGTSTYLAHSGRGPLTTNDPNPTELTGDISLAAGDYIEIEAYSDTSSWVFDVAFSFFCYVELTQLH